VTGALSNPRTRGRRLAWLLLPALLLRAVIPIGFMPLAGADGAYLGFCPGAGSLPASAEQLATHASHFGHAHHSGGVPGTPGTQHHPACVFSAGAATEFASLLSAALAASVSPPPAARVTSLIVLPTILRAQSSRGPPIRA